MTRAHRDPVGLALGSIVSGLLAYVLFALLTRGLGAATAAPVSVLWTLWAFAGAAFTFPLQHWITRSMVAGHEADVRRAAGRVAAVVLVAALALGGLSWLIRDQLFRRDDAWFPAMVVLVILGSGALGVVRGGLGGRGRFESLAWSLVAENALRCLLVGLLLLAGVRDPVAHGLCLVAGSLVALWPTGLRLTDSGAGESRPFAFLSGAAAGQVISQSVLTGGPVLLALLGGSPHEVTAMFAALALFRAPYMVVLGSASRLTLRVAEHSAAGDRAALWSFARGLAVLTVVAVGLAGVLGGLWGPDVLQLVFGDTVDVGAGLATVLALGCTLALTNLVLSVGGLAQGRAGAVAGAWGVAVLAGAVGVVGLSALSPADRSSGAFLTAEIAAMAALAVVTVVAVRSPRTA